MMRLVRVSAILISTLLVAVTKAQDVSGNELLECPFDTGSEIEFYNAAIGISGLPDSCNDNDLITIGMLIQDVVDEVEARMPQYQGEKSITLVCPFPKNTLEDERRGLQERSRYAGRNYKYIGAGRACRRCRNRTRGRRRMTVNKEESNSVCTIAEKARNLQDEAAYSASTCNNVLQSMQKKARDKSTESAVANGILLQARQASQECQKESLIASEAVTSAMKLCEMSASTLRSSSDHLLKRAQEELDTTAAAVFRAKKALTQVRRASFDLSTLYYSESIQGRHPTREVQERKLQEEEICEFSNEAAHQESIAKAACEESDEILNRMEKIAKTVDSKETWKVWGMANKNLAKCEKDLIKAEKAKSKVASMCDEAKQGKAKGSDKAKKELDTVTLVAQVAELYLSEIGDYEIEINSLNGGSSSLEKNIAKPVPTGSPTAFPLSSTPKVPEKEIAPSQEKYLNLLSTNLEKSDTSCETVKQAMIQKTIAEETVVTGDKVYDEIMALAHDFEGNLDIEKIKAKAEKSHLLVEAEAVKARAAADLASELCSQAQTRFRARVLVEKSVQEEVEGSMAAALGAHLALSEVRLVLDEMEEAIALNKFAPTMTGLEAATDQDEKAIVKHLDSVESEIHNVDFQIEELPDTSPEGSALETKRGSLVEEKQLVQDVLAYHETFLVTESALTKDKYYNSVCPDFAEFPPLQYSLRAKNDGGILAVETNWNREDEASDPKKAWFGRFGDYLVADLGVWLTTAYNTLEGGCIPEDTNLSVDVVVTELTTIWEKLNQEVCSSGGDVVSSEEPDESSSSCPESAAGPIPVGGRAIWSSDSRGYRKTFYYREFDGSLFKSETLQGGNTLDRYTYGFGSSSSICYEQLYVGVAADGKLSGTRWDGSTWKPVAIATNDREAESKLGTVSDRSLRAIVGAYESQSGHAMIVYNSGIKEPWLSYSVFDGTWSESMDVDPLYVGGQPKWFDISTSPVSNQIVVAFSGGNRRDIFAAVWDGATWTPTIDFTDTTYDGGFAVSFEAISGRAILVYASKKGSQGNNCLYRIWDGSTWGNEEVAFPLGDHLSIKWAVLQSDPLSNRLAISAILPRGCVLFSIWNGSGWEATEESCNLSDGESLSASVAFESKSGEALAVFGESGTSNVFYKTLKSNGSTTWSDKMVVGNAQATPTSMSLYSNPDLESNQIMLLVKNNNNSLLAVPWDGKKFGDFTILETDTGNTVGLNANMPFTFIWNPAS